MVPLIEILVHVSGLSRGADDAKYRNEALGFLNFEVAERHAVLGERSSPDCAVEQPASQVGTVDAEENHLQGRQTSSHAKKATDALSVREEFRTPVFSRPTASTLQWTAVKQTPHLLIERTPALPHPQTAAPIHAPLSKAPPPRPSQSDSWQTPPSEIPDSQPTPPSPSLGSPDIPSSPSLKRPFDSSSPSPTRPASPAAKRPRLQASSLSPSEDPPVETRPSAIAPNRLPPSTKGLGKEVTSSPPRQTPAVAAAPSAGSAAENPLPSSKPVSDVWRKLEIHPPRPEPSKSAFKTHLTSPLQDIARILPLEQHFKPITTTRTPRVLERGHWLVPINTFDEGLKHHFWDFLNKLISTGRAGWGTWCVRENSEHSTRARRDSDKENEEQSHKVPQQQDGEVVKVYCWGEVVREIWLMLFIGTGRAIKKVGAKWVDAGGVAVVCM